MNKKIIFILIFCLVFFWSALLFPVEALIVPQVYFTDLKLEKENFLPGESIKGSVSLWNYEQFVISDLVFHFELLGGEVDGVATQMIDEKKGEEIFSLSPGQEITKSFSYNLPSNLPEGSFKFRIQLANNKGEEMSWIDKVIGIGGEGEFLTLDNYWIVKDGKDLSPGGGVYYQPGEIPEIRFDVTNNSGFTITAFPKVITYKRNVGQFLNEIERETLILKPTVKQTIKTTLPQMDKPETYLSEIRFYDLDTKEPISNFIYFRWIISGEDAEILFVNPDQESYQSGEEAKVEVQYTGPAHFEVEGGKGTIEIKLLDQKGKIVGEEKKEVELEVGQTTINVPIKEDVDNPKIITQIVKEGKTLDQYEFQTKPVAKEVPKEVPKEKEKVSFFERNKKIIISLTIFILIIGIIIYFLITKKMKAAKNLVLLALLGVGILFGNYILAATEVTGGCCDTTIVFNNPKPDQSYNIGDTINFSGRFRVTGCGDGLFFNKVTFYITEDKEIPTTNCCGDTSDVCRTGIENCSCPEGCQNCYGATSKTYTHCRFRWCDEVRILDLNKSKSLGYKVYKLGTVYPADVAKGAKPYWVEYNQSFIIPSDLGFSGPVRFYVQYSGTHWASHWHWNITYQKGRIITYPDTPTELFESWNDCTFEQLSVPTFHWKYSHPDKISPAGYQIKIYGEGTLDITTDSPSASYTPPPVWVRDNLFFGEKTYYWQVRVKDNYGNWSDWSDFKEFKTRSHPYPWIEFSWSPERPSQEEIVVFNPDESQTFDNLPINEANFEWIITQGDGTFTDGTDANSQYPHIKFSTLENRVKLRVEDSFGCWCDLEKNIDVQMPLPRFKEIPPIIWLRNFFAGIVNLFNGLKF